MSWTMIQLMISAVALFWAGVTALTAFAVQLAILNLTGRRLRPLRWAPLAVPVLALAWAVYKIMK